jgi:cysteine desulfuration protein SufE
MPNLPGKLQEIVDDFALAEKQEKVELLIQYAESLPPLPAWLEDERDTMDAVPECMTPVHVFGELKDGRITFHFDIPPQAPTVRGLAAILANGLNGCTPEEILSVPADFYLAMDLQEAISHQRLNGFMGILAHMKQIAVRKMGGASEGEK